MLIGFIQNMGPWQILICVLIIAVLFGGKKSPELARSLGKAKNEFKKGLAEGEKDDEDTKQEDVKKVEKV